MRIGRAAAVLGMMFLAGCGDKPATISRGMAGTHAQEGAAATQPAPAPAPAAEITKILWNEAKDHLNETAVVTGPIVAVHVTKGGHLQLSMGKKFPDPECLQVFIRAENQAGIPEDQYNGKTIAVTGMITLFNKTTQIEVMQAADIAEQENTTITWDQAAEHVGETAVVTGPVVATNMTKQGHIQLSLGEGFASPDRVTVFIRANDRAGLPDDLYLGKNVAVTGAIARYQGAVQIEVSAIQNIAVQKTPGGAYVASAAPSPGTALPESEEEAIAAIRKCGGTINPFELGEDGKAAAPDEPAVEVIFYKPDGGVVESIDHSTAVTDAGLTHLKALKELRSLTIEDGSRISDVGLKSLKNLSALQTLVIWNGHISAAGLYSLRELKDLRILSLQEAWVNGGMEALSGLSKLESLTLCFNYVSDAELAHLKGLREIRDLDLAHTNVTDKGLVNLQGMSKLRVLNLAATAVTDAGLDQLKEMSQLEKLDFTGTQVTDEGVKKLREELPKCKIAYGPPLGSPR